MGRRRYQFLTDHLIDTELDLAPLLSIMVKLIPVLLLSSAFVQVTTIDTELPMSVKAAIAKPNPDQMANIEIKVNYQNGFKILVDKLGDKSQSIQIDLIDGQLNYEKLNSILTEIKIQNPQVFDLTLTPESNIKYQDIVKIMDTARKPIDKNILFNFINPNTQSTEQTPFMFPDVSLNESQEG